MGAEAGPRLEVGRITRPHGLRGEVLVSLLTTEPSRLAGGSVLWAGPDQLRVRRATRHHTQWIVDFDGVTSRQQAEDLAGQVLTAPAKEAADDGDDQALWVHDLVGARVVEVDGTDRGRVTGVLANPASDLLELESGALVPLRFVVGTPERTEAGVVVQVDPPAGLFES
jgi:16S rRNA processing protein RimM